MSVTGKCNTWKRVVDERARHAHKEDYTQHSSQGQTVDTPVNQGDEGEFDTLLKEREIQFQRLRREKEDFDKQERLAQVNVSIRQIEKSLSRKRENRRIAKAQSSPLYNITDHLPSNESRHLLDQRSSHTRNVRLTLESPNYNHQFQADDRRDYAMAGGFGEPSRITSIPQTNNRGRDRGLPFLEKFTNFKVEGENLGLMIS